MVLEFESDLSTMQKNELLILAESDSQIYGSYNARDRLLRFIRKHEEELEEEIINRYRERI